MKAKKVNKKTKLLVYVSPDIKVNEIVIEQNLLAEGSGDSQNFRGENW